MQNTLILCNLPNDLILSCIIISLALLYFDMPNNLRRQELPHLPPQVNITVFSAGYNSRIYALGNSCDL